MIIKMIYAHLNGLCAVLLNSPHPPTDINLLGWILSIQMKYYANKSPSKTYFITYIDGQSVFSYSIVASDRCGVEQCVCVGVLSVVINIELTLRICVEYCFYWR